MQSKIQQGRRNFLQRRSINEIYLDLADLLDSRNQTDVKCQCVMVLNNDIIIQLLHSLEGRIKNVILVDGGANRVYRSSFRDSDKIKCIIGDLDSVQPQVIKFYSQRGVKIVKDQNQDNNDFQKTIDYAFNNGIKEVICLGTFPGRMDHMFASMSNTQKYLKDKPQYHIILIGLNSLMIYLHKDINYTINMDSQQIQKKGCGLVTFGQVNHIQTQGFKWNMGENHYYKSLQWGNFLSTSNQIEQKFIKVTASDPVFFVGQINLKQK